MRGKSGGGVKELEDQLAMNVQVKSGHSRGLKYAEACASKSHEQ